MPIIVVGKERTLEAVAASVLPSRASKSTHAATLVALRRANPGLEQARLTPGTVLVLPDVVGVRASVSTEQRSALDELAVRARAALDEFAATVEQLPEAPRAERDRVNRLLARADLKRAGASSAALRRRLAGIGEAARTDAKDAPKHADAWREAIAHATADLDALRSRR